MTSKETKYKISKILDQIDINQLKVLIDQAGVVVLQIKNYGTLNIGNYDESEYTTEDYTSSSSSYSSSYDSSCSESSSSSASSSESSSEDEEENKIEEKQEIKKEEKPKVEEKQQKEEKSKIEEKQEIKKEEKTKIEENKITEKEFNEKKQILIEEQNKLKTTSKTKLKVEEIDEDDDFQKKLSETESAAEYVAKTQKIQNSTNNVEIDKKLAIGYMHVNNNKYVEAIEYFSKLIKEYPNVVGAFLARGTSFALLRQYDHAINDFSYAIKLDPKCADAYRRRAQVYMGKNLNEKALNDIEKSIELTNGENYELFIERGTIYQAMKDYEKAREDYRKSVRKSGNNQVAWNQLGLCCNALGLVGEAADAYARALQIDDKYLECYINLGQLHKDAGNFSKSKQIFEKLIRMKNNHSLAYYIYGVLYQQSGNHLEAVKKFDKAIEFKNDKEFGLVRDIDRMTDCFRYRGVTRSASGQFKLAIEDFNEAMNLKSDDVAWYMKEIALYTHHLLDKPFSKWNLEQFDELFKEGFCKKLIPAALHRYEQQKEYDTSIKDISEKDLPSQNVISKLIIPVMNIGKYIQYDSQGFVHNKSQYLMAGLASIAMAKRIRDVLPEWVYGCLTEEQAKPYINKIGWREIMNIAVQYRQISEPNDPVFWIDGLTEEQFQEGFGSHTAMYIGQTRVVRYYCQYNRAFELLKKLMPEQVPMKTEWVEKLKECKNVQDILEFYKGDFHVTTKCKSINVNKENSEEKMIYQGTRLIVELSEPHGYTFAIKTPCTKDRWKLYEKELDLCWKKIVKLVLTRRGKEGEEEKMLRAMFDFAFYWYNFMPLSRGTAACGFIFMMALLASLNYKITKYLPKGMQVDWEAILCDDPIQFEEVMLNWMVNAIDEFDVESIPDYHKIIPTTRDVIKCFNYCPNVNCD